MTENNGDDGGERGEPKNKRMKIEIITSFLNDSEYMLDQIVADYPSISKEISRKEKYSFSKCFTNDMLQYILSFCFDSCKEAFNLIVVCKDWHKASRYKTFWRKYASKGIEKIKDEKLAHIVDPFHPFWWGDHVTVSSSKHLEKTICKTYMHAIPKKHKEFFIYINAANRKMYLYNSLDRIVYGLFDQECNRKEGYCGNGYDITYFCNTEDRMTLKGRIENYVFHQIEEATIKLTCGEYSGEAIELDNTILKHKKGKFKWAKAIFMKENLIVIL